MKYSRVELYSESTSKFKNSNTNIVYTIIWHISSPQGKHSVITQRTIVFLKSPLNKFKSLADFMW